MEQISILVARALLALVGCTEKLPTIAKYIAQDSNGQWYAYSIKPELDETRGVWTLKHAKTRENFWSLSDGMQVADHTLLYEIIR